MLRSIVFVGLVALVATEKKSFDNYKVFRVLPVSAKHLDILKKLENATDGYSYWSNPSPVFRAADLMVSPDHQAEFAKLMDTADMRYATYVENVQSLIDREYVPESRAAGFNWTRYHKLQEIYDWLECIAKVHPEKVAVVNAGRSYEGRAIKGVKLSFGAKKPGVFVEGGIHAREWISPATVTYLINALLTSDEPKVRQLAEAHDWYVFPVFNPDGYVYTHTTNRLWRKTRSPGSVTGCFGTDANRNWGYKWMHGGAESCPCAETYGGPSAFSEPETKSMSEYIGSIGHKLFAYLSFHSYAQMLLFPYGHTSEHLDNYDEAKAIGLKTVEALYGRYGTRYESGSVVEVLSLVTGSSMDWAKATFKLPLSFTYELRDSGVSGFLLPPEQIIPNSEEVLDSLIALFKEANKFGYPANSFSSSMYEHFFLYKIPYINLSIFALSIITL